MFSWAFCKILPNTIFIERLRATASVYATSILKEKEKKLFHNRLICKVYRISPPAIVLFRPDSNKRVDNAYGFFLKYFNLLLKLIKSEFLG